MVLATFVTGIIVYPHLPLVATSRWNILGYVSNTLPRFWAAFLLPSVLLVLSGVWALLPRIDPIAPGFRGFRYAYDFFWILLTAFYAYLYALTLGGNFGWRVDIVHALAPALAVLIIITGVLLPRIKRNWCIGIRTPWSLLSDEIWDKTHRLGSRLFVLAGVIIFAAAFTSRAVGGWLIITPVVLTATISVLYSYTLFSRNKNKLASSERQTEYGA